MKIANPTARLGEDLATNYLKKNGYQVLERNFRKGYGELDIIAIDKTEKEYILAFVEVKTRTSNEFGTGFEAITYFKLQSLLRTAQFYKMTHKNLPELMRVDAIVVMLEADNEVKSIELRKNIS